MKSRPDNRSIRLGVLFATAAMSTVTAASAAHAQAAPSAPAAQPNSLEEIVVTARRSDERLQSVPVAVSVVTPQAMARKGTLEPTDLPSLATGLTATASISDRSNITYSIRGQNQTYSTLFPAVITYFNEVPVTRIATGNFYDLDNIQVLRGPQGVLFGRVTDGGNVMLTPKHPTNDYSGYVEARVGDYNLHSFDAAINVPIVSDKVLLRAAFAYDRRDGFTKNDYNGQDLDNLSSDAFRVGLILRPIDIVENYTVVSYQNVHNNGTSTIMSGLNPTALNASTEGLLPLFTGAYGLNANGQVLPFQAGLTPLTPASYLASLQSQLAAQQARGPRHVYLTSPSFDSQHNLFLVNTTSVDITPDIQFKNIAAYTKNTEWEASNFAGDNSNLITTCHSACAALAGSGSTLPFFSQEQFSEELRLAGKSFNRKLTWSLGAYFDHQKPGGQFENDTINVGILQRDGVQYSDTWSKAAFGYLEYDFSDFLPGFKLNGGYRYTEDKVKSSTATYIAPIASPLAVPAMTAVLGATGVPASIASVLANQTVNFQIPYGQCVSPTTESILGPFECRTFEAKTIARTWSVGASYELPSGQLFYVKASRGYRPGGVNGSAPVDVSAEYGPEYDKSVEVGMKADWRVADIPFRTNVALFHDDYTNIQKQIVIPGPVPLQIVRNVAAATIQGVEFEGTVRPTNNLTLNVNYAYTDAHFQHQDTTGPTNPCDPTAVEVVGFCTDNWLAYTPRNQVSFTVDYQLPVDENLGEFHVGGLLHHQSRIALTDTSVLNPLAVEPAYTTLDLNASWTNIYHRPVDLSFFMTNITDKLYRIGANDLTQNSSVGVRTDIYAPPRMFGFSVKYHFGAS